MEVAHDPCAPTRITAYRHPGSDSESCCSAKATTRSEGTGSEKSGQRAGEGPGWWELVSGRLWLFLSEPSSGHVAGRSNFALNNCNNQVLPQRNLSTKHASPCPGQSRLGLVQGGTEAMRRKCRHQHRPGDRPHPRVIGWHARPRFEDAPNITPVVDHVVVVWSPCPRAALAGVAQDQCDRLSFTKRARQLRNLLHRPRHLMG